MQVEYLSQDPDYDPEGTVLQEVFRGASPILQVLRDYEAVLGAAAARPGDEALQAQVVFEQHFSEVFTGLDASRLNYPVDQLVDLIKWLLAKTRKDVLLEIAAGCSPEAARKAYLDEWEFFCSVLSKGIYQTKAD